ncbi:hypothetical protein MMC19_000109 [Ptychographa xylographoides]|nr:hypothetical protein [Ptychographa xylographoides]
MTEDSNLELEQFRKQWREEVVARSKNGGPSSQRAGARPEAARRKSSSQPDQGPRFPIASAAKYDQRDEEYETFEEQGSKRYHDLEDKDERRRLGEGTVGVHPSTEVEPQSALEHYEKAVEKENQGSLGDSLTHYRKAYRLDAKVDQTYKNKYFPPSSLSSKPANSNPSNAAVTVPNPAHHSLHGPPNSVSNVSELITSFATDAIHGAPPSIEGTPPPPCPIASLPLEVLLEILLRSALTDIAAYVRLSLVCKRLAYLSAVEDRIWKRVCVGAEFGLSAMHYDYACTIDGTPLPPREDDNSDVTLLFSNLILEPPPNATLSPTDRTLPLPPSLPLPATSPTYAHMFHHFPRLRFAGVYISTVNYVRPGASSPTSISWNTPVHIVTYYRYLRFFRDGSCISLLTTSEPVEVVHHLLKEHLHSHHSGGLPSSVMKHALRGRWRLNSSPFAATEAKHSSPADADADPTLGSVPATGNHSSDTHHLPPPPVSKTTPASAPALGTLSIETQGPDQKYTYSMSLALRSASSRAGATRNNKLVWRGFWSYNRLTDDWAEFGLRNDRPFFWSRVRSWGVRGE